jgi:hypothetical protein
MVTAATPTETAYCLIICSSRPSGTNAVNVVVVNDRADTRREFCSQSGCFLLLDRMDKSPVG